MPYCLTFVHLACLLRDKVCNGLDRAVNCNKKPYTRKPSFNRNNQRQETSSATSNPHGQASGREFDQSGTSDQQDQSGMSHSLNSVSPNQMEGNIDGGENKNILMDLFSALSVEKDQNFDMDSGSQNFQ